MLVIVVIVMALAGVSVRVAYFPSLEASSGQSRRRSRATAFFRMLRSIFCYSGRKLSEINQTNMQKSSHRTKKTKISYI